MYVTHLLQNGKEMYSMSISGQNYSSSVIVKNGQVRGKQRYRCRIMLNNFVLGDGRVDPETATKSAFAVLLYGLGKASYGLIAKLFGVTPFAV